MARPERLYTNCGEGGIWRLWRAFYVLAKALEALDGPIFELGHIVSGHTLKHLAAAGAGYWILRMLLMRRLIDAIHGGQPRTGAEVQPREFAGRNSERHRRFAPHR